MRADPPAMRRSRILARIRERGAVTIAELAREHDISTMTAHRDLEALAGEGLVERIRGGAKAVADAPHPTAWEQRIGQSQDAKAAIAVYAATLIAEGATIFLDASSSAYALARALMAAPPYELTLVTNSPSVAAEMRAEAVHVVVCPGELDQQTRAITGRWTTEFIGGLSFDTAFVSAAGITPEAGLTTSRAPLADVVNAARRAARRTVGLVDSAKVGRVSLVSVAGVDELELIVTDAGVAPGAAAALTRAGARLHVV